ncbi:hypothetical protein FF100_33015 [Methylobacterium terricola]|uniref:Secreted protein n=1 Tax=Methylobacterium terricola TaxID=2583531 RepID=A0A5C4L6N2_9HYPH|nr:hypothetical protein [Methylobacterium terricola]TNC07261.1 hypothetical protein FF100_33015 [Methylobacterium terricola]
MSGRARRGAGSSVPTGLALSGLARAVALGASLAASPWPALAAEGDCFGYGELGAGPGPTLGTVKAGAARVPFLRGASERKGCPGPDPACRETAFVVPGNTVILAGAPGEASPGFVCATYVGQKGTVRSGWLPEGAVARAPDAPGQRSRDWTGIWRAPEATLVIRQAKAAGALSVKGDATFGALDPDRVRRGAVNLGSVDGTMAPSGPSLAFTMGDRGTLPYAGGEAADCRLRLTLLPPFLLAQDNNACGGMNVSFTNVYRRTKP